MKDKLLIAIEFEPTEDGIKINKQVKCEITSIENSIVAAECVSEIAHKLLKTMGDSLGDKKMIFEAKD